MNTFLVHEIGLNLNKLNLYLFDNKIITKEQFNSLELLVSSRQNFRIYISYKSLFINKQNLHIELQIPFYYNEMYNNYDVVSLRIKLQTITFFDMIFSK